MTLTRPTHQGRRLTLAALVATALAVAVFLAPAHANASTGIHWGTGTAATLPSNAASPSTMSIGGSCASPGNCTAVGEYYDGSKDYQGLLLTETSGIWASGVEAALPANAGSDPNVLLGPVSCTAPGDCTAVGTYWDSSYHTQGLLLTETRGVWATGVEATLPGNAAADPQVVLSSVSCASPGNCTAVGYESGYGLILTQSSGIWAVGFEPTLPAGAGADPAPQLVSVSCPSAGDCTAVGKYIDTSDQHQVLLLTETSGVWATGAQGALPANAGSFPYPTVTQVSCASAGNCVAVGAYSDTANQLDGLLFDQNAGTWQAGTEARMPAGSGPRSQAALSGVSCPSDGSCAAVGEYFDAANNQQGLMLNESGGTWGTGVAATLPADARSNPYASIYSVSCASAGDCAAIGHYTDSPGSSRSLLISESGRTWTPAVEPTLPSDGVPDGSSLASISCGGLDSCSVVGTYQDASGDTRGLLINGTPFLPAVSADAPLAAVAGRQIAPSSITATVSGGGDPTGQVTFTVFGPQPTPPTSCTTGGTTVGTASISGDRTYHPSAGFLPPSPGDYWWYASYGGDTSNGPAASACGTAMPETAVVTTKPINISPPRRSSRLPS